MESKIIHTIRCYVLFFERQNSIRYSENGYKRPYKNIGVPRR